jgi:cellobiose-specific phosphotransferase system component IIA
VGSHNVRFQKIFGLESDLEQIKSYKGDTDAAKDLLTKAKKSLKAAKTERKSIIAKLLKAQDAARRS